MEKRRESSQSLERKVPQEVFNRLLVGMANHENKCITTLLMSTATQTYSPWQL